MYLPSRRVLHANLNAALLVAVGFAAASGLILLFFRYRPGIHDRARQPLWSGRSVFGKGKSVWQRIMLPWKLILTLGLCSVLACVAFWEYRSRQAEGKPVPEGYTLDKTNEPRASAEGVRSVEGVRWDDKPVAVQTLPESTTTKPIDRSKPPAGFDKEVSYKAAVPAPVTTVRSSVRAPKDIGVDVAIPNRAQIRMMDGPSPNATQILTIGARDTLALIERQPTNGWFNVIHVRSGKEGWVNGADVRLAFTTHPLPPPVFSEEYVGRDAAPVLKVINKTDRELSLRIDDSRYTVASGKSLEVSHPGGACKFFASAPGAIPLSGTREWKRGHRYEWTFWIERGILPGISARSPASAK
jgi:hypothetical protein